MRWDGGRVLGGAAAALGAVAVVMAGSLAEGTATGGPGTRFLPSLLGGLMVLLGGLVALGRAGPPAEPAPAAAPATAGPPEEAGRRVLTTVAVIVGYTLVLDRLGFLLATVALVGILVRLYGERRWPVVVGVAVGAAAGTYGLFATWLKVPLPPGLLAP